MKRIEKKESRKRRGAFMLAMAMVLSFVLPLCQSVSNAVSEGDLYFPTGGGSQTDDEMCYVPPTTDDSDTYYIPPFERSSDDYYTPPVRQSAGTYFSVKDQYGRPVNNVYFVITNINASPNINYYGKASDGILWIYNSSSQKYENTSLENAGFNVNQYHDLKVYTGQGDADNYNLDASKLLSRFYLSNGKVIFAEGSSANIVLQSKSAPPPVTTTGISVKDTNDQAAAGIAFRLYKEGQANIQKNLESDASGDLVYSANATLFDPESLDEGTYILKATPQVSTAHAKETYSIDGTKVFTTITVTADEKGEKSVVFSPEGSRKLVFPLIANVPKGNGDLTVNKVDEKGDPLGGVTFQIQGPVDSSPDLIRQSQPTDQDGKTVFSGLPYGEYLLKEVSAPAGYVVSERVIHVMLGKDSDAPYVGGKDVTDRLKMTSVKWNPPHIEDGVNTIYPNQAESLSVDSVIKVPTDGEPIVPGDTFTVTLSDNVDTYGLVRSAEQGLDIFANGGKLAEGKFDPDTRTITYTFTNLVKTFTANEIKLHTVLFIDKVKVPQEVSIAPYLSLTYGLQGQEGTKSTSDFKVLYRPYYYPQATGGSNIGTMYSIYNPDKKTATTYIYVNPLNNSLKKSKLEITGKGSVLVNDLTDVKVYDGGSGSADTMVPSWGLVPDSLTKINDFEPIIDGNANRITIDLGDKLASGERAYIIKVTTGYDPSSTEDLGMVAKLYGYHNGYWSRYYNYSYYDYDWAAAQTYMKFYEHEASATGVNFDASVTVSNPKNAIEWTKVNESGLPLEGAEFKLVRVGETEELIEENLRSNRDGRLSASGLAPGLYKLYETKAPEGYEIPTGDDGKSKPLSVFSVDEDGEITEMNPADGKLINGRMEGRFSIHKTDDAEEETDRKPLKEVEFTLTPLKEEPAGTWIPDSGKEVITKTTDENGDITFAGLPLGRYRLEESKAAPGYMKRDTTWTVEVKEEAVDDQHPDIMRIVTVVTEDASPAAKMPAAQSDVTVKTSTDKDASHAAGLPLSPLSEMDALSMDESLRHVTMQMAPLRSVGGGKYQFNNPQEVDQAKWPNNIQEVDANGDGKADYKITQTMAPDGTTPGQYKVNVKVEKMPETMELVILMDNASAFAQTSGNKIDRFQWGGQVGGTLEIVPTAYQWLDYYFGGNRAGQGTKSGRVTDLLQTVKKTYPNAKVTLIGAGGAKSTVQYWVTNPYTGVPIDKAIQMNRQLNASGFYNPNAPEPKWEFAGGWGRMGLKDAMQKSYNTLNGSTAKKKVFFHLQGMPTFSKDTFTAPYLEWWDTDEANDARSTFAKIRQIAQVNWLVELDPSEYDDSFFRPQEYLDNGLPDPSKIHFLQKTSRFWLDKDQYWNQVDKQAMEAAYDNAINAIADNITSGSGSRDTLDLRIRLADNVLWREPADDTMSKAGVTYDDATGSLTKSNFTMTSDKPLEFSYYVKANSQASTAKFNVFENINDANTTGLKVSWKNPDGTKADKTSPMPIPQLRIPGWETHVTKYWYGNTAADNKSFADFPETGTNPPTAPANPLAESKRKASQVLVYSDATYSDDQETKIGVAQRMVGPYESLDFARVLPYYDNDGNRIDYTGTEYHDALFRTKTNLIQNDASLKQTFYIGAQMDPVAIKTDIDITKQWGAGTTTEDQVPVKVKLLAYRVKADGTQELIEGDALSSLLGNATTEMIIDEASDWKGSFKDLPTSQIDQSTGEATEIVYRIKEEPLPGFDVSYLYDYEDVLQEDGTKKPTHYYTIVNQKHELLKVTNAPNEVDFYKVDGDGNPLAGAIFTLQKEENGTWNDVKEYTKFSAEEVTEQEQQRQKIHLEKLLPGDYRLMETAAPEGYEVPKDPVATFSVSEETGKVEAIQVLGEKGELVRGESGSTIVNLPPTPVAFYMEKWGTQAEGEDEPIVSGKLMVKLASKTKDGIFKTFIFDLSKDYKTIPESTKEGLEIIIPSDWPSGIYELTEEIAPAGYRKLDEPIRLRYTKPSDPNSSTGRKVVQIDANGEVLATLYEEEIIDGIRTPKYGESYVPLRMVDEHSVYPYTAGPGTVLFSIAGAFLMTMAIALGGLSKRKEKL